MGKFAWCGPPQQSRRKQLSSEERSPEVPFRQKNADADQIIQICYGPFFFSVRISPFLLEILILRIRKYKL